MRTVSYRLADLSNVTISLGFVGENEHTRVQFDAKKIFEQYPDAIPALTVKPPNGDAYPAVITLDGDLVIWDVSDSDLAYQGMGEIQLVFTEGETVAKSYIAKTRISRSIVPTGEVPTPVENWMAHAAEVLEEVDEAIPTGGTTGQVLAKKSDADRDTEWVDQTGGGGGTSNYNDLSNKPQIGGVTLSGNKTLHDLGAAAEADIPDVSGFYTKPAAGIPASDIADGVIPVVHNVPAGGSANQVLAKNSGTDYDMKWVNQSGGGGGAEIDDTAGEGDTTVVWSADKTWTETNGLKEAIEQLAENGYYETGSGSGDDVYFTMSVGMINKNGTNPVSQNIDPRSDTAYIIIEKANVPNVLYFDDTKFKANLVFIKNNYEIAETYTSWDTTSPLEFTEPGEWDSIGINARKLSGNVSQDELSAILYKKESGRTQVGNLATKDYVDNNKHGGLKCIYPDAFDSRIKPNIYFNGKYYADIDPSDYIISGTGEVWVATNGNDSTGDGTENNPYATITKALTESAVTIHIKEGTYTQGTDYEANCYLGGKNVIGHGTVVFQNDSSGHYASASSSAYFENITFKHGHATTGPAFSATCTASGKCICFVKCTFRDGGTNGLAVEGTDAVLFECVAYGNRYDGLNYHARTLIDTTYIPNVLEVDCKAYNNGTDQSGSDSCNGSTAHDGARIIRLNGEYYSCYGGVIAEIGLANEDPTISVNYGVLAHESTGTGTYKASFWASVNTKMYLYDCKSYGGTYDISAINDAEVISLRLTTGRDSPAINVASTASVQSENLPSASGVSF